jgi:predicted SnoaL-like aldol condensation-catalyzing enzyme
MLATQTASYSDRNKATTLRFFDEAFNKGNLSVVDESISPEYTFDGKPNSVDQVKGFVTALRTGMPNLNMTVQHILAEGDLVALHWQLTGTKAEAPHNQVTASGTNLLGFNADGKAVFNIQNGGSTIVGTLTFGDSQIYR